MKLRANFVSPRRSQEHGFSLVELVLSLVVLLIITTIAVPVVVRSLQTYQLNSISSQLAGMLKFTKFEAIRENTPVSCQIQLDGTRWLVYADSNGNTVADGNEPRMYVGGPFTLLPEASVPSPSPIMTALGGDSTLPRTVVSGTNGSITYDHRGVINTPNVFILYVGSASNPISGYRAVVTLPSGAVQEWTSPPAGPWRRIS